MKVFLMTKPSLAKVGDKMSSGASTSRSSTLAEEHTTSRSEWLTQDSADDTQLHVSSDSAPLELHGDASVSLSALL